MGPFAHRPLVLLPCQNSPSKIMKEETSPTNRGHWLSHVVALNVQYEYGRRSVSLRIFQCLAHLAY